ncbi:MAG: TonB-dependent receptor [Steroidobacterales bacterium]
MSEKLIVRTRVGAAVLCALYGLPPVALADQKQDLPTETLQEVIVTATRRAQTAEEVPYSLSVISSDQLERANVTDMASLAAQVPGLSIYDYGARYAGATAPIIRGLNATGEPRGFRTFEQDPVGTYIGNSPMSGYFQLDDMQQVEILRGPQGTLYGAGALGGAIRFIPNKPKLGELSGEIGGGASMLGHSNGTGSTVNGTFNVPVGDTLAFRASGKYVYEPGFIDAYGLIQRDANGLPVLANPSDPVNSPAIYSEQKDWNSQRTFTGRASGLWKPNETFNAELAFLYSTLNGAGGPQDNPDFAGGPYPIDPRVNFPAGNQYREFTPSNQPYSRTTSLTSLDLSYDAGFATISSTSSYYKTDGATVGDDTYHITSFASYISYYAGNPTNPRYFELQEFDDKAHSFTEELRLVSAAGPDKLIDYTVGLYYEKQERVGSWNVTDPGSYERSVAQGCTAPFYSGASFPNCLMVVGPNDAVFNQVDTQNFTDKSVFGELTWHFAPLGQVTFGGRHFQQDFVDAQSYTDYPFATFLPAIPHSSPATKNTWKINPSYQYAKDQYVYMTWSEGFRRGGANSVPQTGFFMESPLLSQYAPDSVNNYEVGLKGRLQNGLTYTFAVFDIEWNKPQISASLPSGNLAVYNGNTARSKGFELESSGPMFARGLTYNFGFAYAQAQLTSGFSLPANNGAGQIIPGLVTGTAGQQLPGSPKISASATVLYERALAPGYDMTLSANSTYRSHTPLGLSLSDGAPTQGSASAFGLINLSATVAHKQWRYNAYITNLADKRAVLEPPTRPNLVGNLTNDYVINRPREAGLRMYLSF